MSQLASVGFLAFLVAGVAALYVYSVRLLTALREELPASEWAEIGEPGSLSEIAGARNGAVQSHVRNRGYAEHCSARATRRIDRERAGAYRVLAAQLLAGAGYVAFLINAG